MPQTPLESKQSQSRSTTLWAPRHCLAAGFAFYLLMILIGSVPGEAAAASTRAPDKLLHFCAYAVITMLLYRGLHGKPSSRAALAVALGAFLGGLDEAIQLFFPYRNADWSDWHFDLIAVLCAVGLSLAATAFAAARMQVRSISRSELPVSARLPRD